MAFKSLSLMIFTLLAFSSLFDVSGAFGGRKTLAPAPEPDIDADNVALAPILADIGITVLNNTDPKVVEVAKFAVDEYNKANNAKLVFSKVMEATSPIKSQEPQYELVILATDDEDSDFYFSTISVVNGVKKVISFNPTHS